MIIDALYKDNLEKVKNFILKIKKQYSNLKKIYINYEKENISLIFENQIKSLSLPEKEKEKISYIYNKIYSLLQDDEKELYKNNLYFNKTFFFKDFTATFQFIKEASLNSVIINIDNLNIPELNYYIDIIDIEELKKLNSGIIINISNNKKYSYSLLFELLNNKNILISIEDNISISNIELNNKLFLQMEVDRDIKAQNLSNEISKLQPDIISVEVNNSIILEKILSIINDKYLIILNINANDIKSALNKIKNWFQDEHKTKDFINNIDIIINTKDIYSNKEKFLYEIINLKKYNNFKLLLKDNINNINNEMIYSFMKKENIKTINDKLLKLLESNAIDEKTYEKSLIND